MTLFLLLLFAGLAVFALGVRAESRYDHLSVYPRALPGPPTRRGRYRT